MEIGVGRRLKGGHRPAVDEADHGAAPGTLNDNQKHGHDGCLPLTEERREAPASDGG